MKTYRVITPSGAVAKQLQARDEDEAVLLAETVYGFHILDVDGTDLVEDEDESSEAGERQWDAYARPQ